MYRNSDSKLIGTYEYDLWGRPVSVKEASAGVDTDGILTKNPLRYRGYYYDNETGFYYLNARYYDPEVRRFISADSLLASAGSSVQGYNLFAYCDNNPVNRMDPSGHAWIDVDSMLTNAFKNVYSIYYNATKWHFEDRAEKNGPHPSYEEVNVKNSEWRLLSESESIFHDNGIGKPELKYITNDGREAVFDGDTLQPMTDPRYIATYNYVPIYEAPKEGARLSDYAKEIGTRAGHLCLDVYPYYETGFSNTRGQYEYSCIQLLVGVVEKSIIRVP